MRRQSKVCFSHFILLLCFAHRGSTDCTLSIRHSSVADSWQSSSFNENNQLLCFNTSSDSTADTHMFLHTALSNANDSNGFHWFAVKLKALTPVTSVKIKSRSKYHENDELMKDLTSRSDNIEVWTSPSSLHFGSDRCSTGNISSHFQRSRDTDWNFCGTSSANGGILNGLWLRVNCRSLSLTRMLLLRKFVANETKHQRQCMNFIDMSIDLIEMKAEMNVSGPVVQNSSLSVWCSKSCITTETQLFRLNLCHPNGQCFDRSETGIQKVQPWDSGNFTCQLDGQVVSSERLIVQYPPAKLGISASDASSCSDESPADVTFTFASSAAEPAPQHRCVASSSGDSGISLMKLVDQESGQRGDALSRWRCSNCSSESLGVTVCCSAVQGLWNSTAEIRWTCREVKSTGSVGLATSVAICTVLAAALISLLIIIQRRRRSHAAVPEVAAVSPTEDAVEMFAIQHPATSSKTAQPASLSTRNQSSNHQTVPNNATCGTADPQECSYASVMPQERAESAASLNSSDASVFLEIIGDDSA